MSNLATLKSGLAAGALLAALTSAANAQNTLLPELIVISPSLTPIEASKTGSSVTAMSGEEARATGFSQLSDVMRTFPGVAVNQSGARGSLTQFRVRGQEANHLLVMIDGVPANAVGDGEYNFADIPLDDIERIELLRGPQSGLYGANAQSGVLTIETKSGRGLTRPEFNGRFEAWNATCHGGGGHIPRRGRAGLRLDHGELRDHQRLQHRARRKRTRWREARSGDRQGRCRPHALLQCRRLRPPTAAQRRIRPAGPVLRQQRAGRRRPRLQPPGSERHSRASQGTLKLFDDRWVQSMKWAGSRNGTSQLRELHGKPRTRSAPRRR